MKIKSWTHQILNAIAPDQKINVQFLSAKVTSNLLNDSMDHAILQLYIASQVAYVRVGTHTILHTDTDT